MLKALESYLTQHKAVRSASFYVSANDRGIEQGARHELGPKGWWTMQLVNGDVSSGAGYTSNAFVDPQVRFLAHNGDLIALQAFTEILDEAILLFPCCYRAELLMDGSTQYVTAVSRSSITLPVIFRPKIQQNSAVAFYVFALKRDPGAPSH